MELLRWLHGFKDKKSMFKHTLEIDDLVRLGYRDLTNVVFQDVLSYSTVQNIESSVLLLISEFVIDGKSYRHFRA